MTTAYEQHLLLRYLTNVAARLTHSPRSARALNDWIAEHGDMLGLENMETPLGEKAPGQDRHILVAALRDQYATTQGTPEDQTARNLRSLGRQTGLSETDDAILNLLLRHRTQPTMESIIDSVRHQVFPAERHGFSFKGEWLCTLLGVPVNAMLRRFMPDAPLVRSGLVQRDDNNGVSISDRVTRLSAIPDDDHPDVMSLLLDTAGPSELAWSDFDHLARDRDHIERLLKGTLRTGASGVNIFLYGPPGTGKTEFCRALADRLGVTLYSVGESDDRRHEPSRDERLSELMLAQCLIAHDRRSLLLFDEMDDLLFNARKNVAWPSLLAADHRLGASKVFMNRLLEQTTAPILWTTNVADGVDPAILRRMTFALELRIPTPAVRARIWARQLSRHGIEATADDARALAAEFDAAPGVATGAASAARLIEGDLATVRHGVRNLSRVLSCGKPSQRPPARFDPAFIHTDDDMVRLANRLAANDERRFSLCLQGPPGTGKSAFARYLAERLGLEVLQKRTSDLLSCWVGGTEKLIAAAFAEARDTESFLMFDEADSLLADRKFAQRNWEISQVNEMLTWMESHPYPFACTTNHREGLDPASLRRFVFKITFDYLTPEQAAAVFRAYFDIAPPKELADLPMLTPGDFAVVRRKAEVLHLLRDAPALADMLRAECDAKPGRKRQIRIRP